MQAEATEHLESKPSSPTSFPSYFWLTGFVLAWAVDLLFWGHPAGLAFPIWIGLGIAGLFAAAFWERRKVAWASYPLAAAALALSLTTFLRSEPFSMTITGLLAVASLGLLAVTLTNGYWLLYRLGDLLLAALRLFAAGLVRAGQALARKPAVEAEGQTPSTWHRLRKTGFPILRGLLLAIPVLAVLGGLLASADPVFGRLLENLLRIFDLDRLPEYIIRFSYVMILTYAFSGVLIFAVFPEPAERPNPLQPWKMRFLGSTEAVIILGSVVLLFAVFVALQLRYLFGGQANITETGFTYSDYARRGFFELVWVAVLSLGLYIGLGAVTRRETAARERSFTILSIALMGLVLVILVSALQRLLLYESAYGFTRLRTYTHIFIPWLAVLLIVAILLQAVGRQGHFGLALLLVCLGFGLTFTTLNVDALITRLNLQRARSGLELDASHLLALSSDAVPELTTAYQDPSLPAADREKIGAVLACKQIAPSYSTDWRALRLSESRAKGLLDGLDLSAYKIEPDDRSPYIVLDGQEFYCYAGYMD